MDEFTGGNPCTQESRQMSNRQILLQQHYTPKQGHMLKRKALLFLQGTILHQILQHSTQETPISEKKISKISQDLQGKSYFCL